MDFQFSEEDILLQQMAANFSHDKMLPYASMWDEQAFFPVDVLKEAAALGMGGMIVREDIGGSMLTRLQSALIFEQLSTGCISTSAYLSIHNMVTTLVDKYASDELRGLWGPRLTSMDSFASYCLTEPGAGSDAASLKTRAVKDGDDYIINGSKAFISGGSVSDVYVCMVRTGDETHHGISCILIEKGTRGLSFGQMERKLGWKNQPTTMVFFQNCRVPIKNRIGEEGTGFKIALNALNGGRINIAACSLGGAIACMRLTKRYLHERKQFNAPLSANQALRFYFSDMLTDLEAARLMVYRAAVSLDKNDTHASMYCAMAKRLATDTAFQISDKAMQIHGGYGYLREYQIERIFRDLRVHQILEGTNEIMREIVAKSSLEEHFQI
jgi:alkylation response protein AidB-like acyl-CoA dehydrogenase